MTAKKPSFTESFPECAESIALFRQLFGADIVVLGGIEGDKSFGRVTGSRQFNNKNIESEKVSGQ